MRELKVKCEHNLPGISAINGILTVTNYKIIFKPGDK